ncbi:MAG: endonuclease [Gammaproteobacteria bacterium]|nr:endonuclease [Gammaproteobacteria bacterium]
MTICNYIDGHYYEKFHPGWGSFVEELFFYTSRYYGVTEAFLRGLTGLSDFSMNGYKAKSLSTLQKSVMATILSKAPDKESSLAVVAIIEKVIKHEVDVDKYLLEKFPPRAAHEVPVEVHGPKKKCTHHPDISPVEPWLNMAERLQMPVAVRHHHIEIDMIVLARYLNSPNETLKNNLHNSIIDLHNAGYEIRNHPHLTHSEAHIIGDEGAV